jgi:serine/threonine-protein kinase
VNRRSFPSGHTSSALLKAMRRSLEASRGADATDAWLRAIRMERDDVEDETKTVPLAMMRVALAAFAEESSRDAIPELWRQLIAPDNLGVWMRVLRGTQTPAEAFARLDSADSEYGRTTRWETLLASPGRWRGRVNIAHDPQLEEDGFLRMGRLAEIKAVPALFGFGPGTVIERAVAHATSVAQEFEVVWRVPRHKVLGAIGASIGFTIGALPLAIHVAAPELALGTAAFGATAGAILGVARARDLVRRAEAFAQSMRVHALERSLVLKEERDKLQAGHLEGSVAAGQYRIVQRMGSGASGVIYEAVRIADGLPVAIKLLRAAAAHDAVASDRLRREAEALGLSWHPNVVEVIDHGHLPDGTAYLVMELLRGESLAHRLKTKTRLTTHELLPIAMQVCDALAAVHAAGVVHRDLKPSNIFLAVDREDPAGPMRVKLLDFGIARVEWEETRITNTGGPLGTPGYMSPEQEHGGEVDGRSDIFALGAVLYEALVGEPPPPRTPSGLVRASDNPASSSNVRLDSGIQRAAKFIPPVWRAVIERAMAVSPPERFADAREVAHALRAAREEIAQLEAK